jgi:aldose 1-epimerase
LCLQKRQGYPVRDETDTGNALLKRAGELFEIVSGNRRAVVTEQGATLFRLNWDGVDLLTNPTDDGFGVEGCHGQALVPFPGRVDKGIYTYEGTRHELAIDEHRTESAIHGWVRWATWQPKEHVTDRVSFTCRILGQPGYPFPFEYQQSYSWEDGPLEIIFIARNIGESTAPFGYGAHPYFTVGSKTVDDDVLQLPADQYYRADEHLITLEPALPVDGTPLDFRRARRVGPYKFDVTLGSLARDDKGRAVVTYASPDSSVSITCTYDEPIKFVQIFSGDTLPAHRREGLAIEPYTCVPDAFNNGLGLLHVPPGGEVKVRWAVSAEVRH